MIQTITHDDLLRHIYGETSESENTFILQALDTDWNLREAYRSLLITKDIMSQVGLRSPSRTSLKVIMDYSSQAEETLELH